MFICDRCLKKLYKNSMFLTSYGRCEECGCVDECADIPSGRLIKKKAYNPQLDSLIDQETGSPLKLWYKKRENNNMEKQIKMSLETARRLWSQLPPVINDNANAFIYRTLKENFTQEELEGDKGFTWEESFDGSGYFLNASASINQTIGSSADDKNKNTFKTKKQAESALAFAQLSHIVAKHNEGKIRSGGVWIMFYNLASEDIEFKYTQYRESQLEFYTEKDAKISRDKNMYLWKKFLIVD